MSITTLFIFLLIFIDVGARAQLTSGDTDSMSTQASVDISFRPSVAVVIGILSVMFSLTFLLLVYAKYCHVVTSSDPRNRENTGEHDVLIPISQSRTSGVDKAVIESLPLFKFSALKGSKGGLECAVCLSKFEDTEVLRLLPTCKHAFHVNCVDKWLESHSSCPLCRRKVDAEDASILILSTSSRWLSQSPSSLDLRSDSNLLEIFVQREPSEHGSSRFSIGSSFRRSDKGKKDESLLQEARFSDDDEDGDNQDGKQLDRFKHRIIISDIVDKNRWSDVNSTDLMFLNSEMLNIVSSQRFSSVNSKTGCNDVSSSTSDGLMKIKEELEMKRLFESKISRNNFISSAGSASDSDHPQPQVMGKSNSRTNDSTLKSFVSSSKRSMSEITNFSRFGELGFKNRIKDQFTTSSSASDANAVKEPRMKSLWFPIARRTVQWIAGRERRSQQPQREKHDSAV